MSTPRLPWESGFLKDVLGSGPPSALPWLSPVLVPRDLPSAGSVRVKVTPSVGEKRSMAKSQMLSSISFGRDEKRQNALAKWLDLVMMYPDESRLGNLILAESMRDPEEESVPKLMEHWMARKSTSTLVLRAGSIAMFVKYCKTNFRDIPVIPIDEEVAYRYVDWLKVSGKPPTRAHAFTSSLSFVAEILGWKGAEEAAHSQRVLGAAHLCFFRKGCLDKPLLLTWSRLWSSSYAVSLLETIFLEDALGFVSAPFTADCE